MTNDKSISLWKPILDAVAATVTPVVAPAFAVVERKQLRLWPKEAPPIVVIYPGADRDLEEAFGNAVLREYQVYLVFIQPGNQLFDAAGIPPIADPKLAAKQALHKPSLDGVAAVYDVLYREHPLFEVEGAKANWDVSALELLFRASEARGA